MILLFLLLFNFNSFGLERTDKLPPPWDKNQAAFDKLDPKMIEAGEVLFSDKILSRDKTISCMSCHSPAHAFSNGREKALGLNGVETEYNVPVLFNRIDAKLQFWDGRVHSLPEQIFHPILAPKEMGMTEELVLERLNGSARYRDLLGSPITRPLVESALSAFVSSLVSGGSRYDRFEAGEKSAMTLIELEGKKLFFETYNCVRCHSGPNFSNESLARRCGSGEGQYAVPYKVPTLRNLRRSAPYLHNGHLATLADVLEFYDQGNNENGFAIKSSDKAKLKAFLETLDAPIVSYRRRSK